MPFVTARCKVSKLQTTLSLLLPLPRPKATLRAPTIDLKYTTGHVSCAFTAQEQDQSRKIFRFPDSARRLALKQRWQGVAEPESSHTGREYTRADAIDRDVVRHQLARLQLREMDTCCFGRAVTECS